MADKKQSNNALIEVTVLTHDHIHTGHPVSKGDKIKVTQTQKEWLLKLNVIEE